MLSSLSLVLNVLEESSVRLPDLVPGNEAPDGNIYVPLSEESQQKGLFVCLCYLWH